MKKTLGTIIFSGDQRDQLLSWSRSSSLDYRYVVRVKIIIQLEQALTYEAIKAKLDVGKTAISKWKKRFIENGVDGLKDAYR